MAQAKNRHHHLRLEFAKFFTGRSAWSVGWRTDSCGEVEGLANRQMREVLVYFLVVYEFSLELFGHFLLWDAVVVDHGIVRF